MANNKITVGVDLSKHYENKIKQAFQTGTSVKIKLSKQNINPNSKNKLMLTPLQYSKLNDGKPHDITISHSSLSKHGGFLPFLLPLLAGLASVAGIAGGVATAVKSSKEAQLADAQKAKIQGSGLKVKRKRKGGCLINGKPTLLPYTPNLPSMQSPYPLV